MEQRRLGNSDISVSTIAIGCWPMGGDYWGGTDDEESVRTIHRALEQGVTFFDTAPAYGAGHSEEVLGRGLAGRRQEAVISTKTQATPEQIRPSLEASLERLQTDYVDLFFVHWPKRSEPLARTMEELEALRQEGVIRAIGVSNFTIDMMEAARQYGTIDALQPPYNLIWRFPEEDVLPYCREHGIGVTTYSSLAQGMLAGAVGLNTTYRGGDMRPRSVLWLPENLGKFLYTVERLKPIAGQLGVSQAQLALRWLIEQEGVTTALVGARTPAEVDDNVGAVGWPLDSETLQQVQAISDDLYISMPYYYDMWGNWSSWNRRGVQRVN
jgi:aryl-alcohol dehydrogenase-like predicted oxidoreductase